MAISVLNPDRFNAEALAPDLGTQLDCDVAIVGAGIVGATLACALRETGLRVVLVESKPKAMGLQNRRAYAVTALSSDIFEGLGVWQAMAAKLAACDRIRLSDADCPQVVWFDSADLGRDHVVYVAEHAVLLEALYDALATSEQIQWLCPAEVVAVAYRGEGAQLTLQHPDGTQQSLTTSLVVAADGGQSPLRRGAAIGTWGWRYWQACIGFTVQTERPHGGIAYERFWPSGPFAILPLPGNRCQVVWTAPQREAERLMQLPEAEFLALLAERFGNQMGRVQLESPRLLFPVRLMQSWRYVQPRLALVGDAAHNCHPVGGQGLNLGIRDAVALAQVLTAAQGQGRDLGAAGVLRRYERWRLWENLLILGFTDLLDRVFSTGFRPLVWVRRLGLVMLGRVPWMRRLALGLMTGQTGRRPLVAGRRP